jgi:ubiquinone/menaquinone biosynthesis C-methylase UbiE
VFELGCGTGRLAARRLRERLPGESRYLGVDVSPLMVRLAGDRLGGWRPRARAELLEPPARALPGADAEFDRFIATYVLDLLTTDDADAILAEAARLLAPTGRLCVVSMTDGPTPGGRLASTGWSAIARRWRALLGGCRPIRLCALVAGDRWRVEQRAVLTRWCIASEILVAAPAAEPRDG